jgi:hypothetical protein
MQNSTHLLCLCASIALLAGAFGCQSGPAPADVGNTSFLFFEGEQQNWPTSPNALVETDWPLPVYREFPSRPYKILGRVTGTQQHLIGRAFAEGLWSDRDRLRNACVQASLRGADAVLLTQDPEILRLLRVPSGEAGRADQPLYQYDGAVVAIQWVE